MDRGVLAFGVLIAGAGLVLNAYTLGKDANELISMRGGYVTAGNMRSAGKGAVLIGLIMCLLSLFIP
jgi:hypothetical protein